MCLFHNSLALTGKKYIKKFYEESDFHKFLLKNFYTTL
jgi:hypothetical protein